MHVAVIEINNSQIIARARRRRGRLTPEHLVTAPQRPLTVNHNETNKGLNKTTTTTLISFMAVALLQTALQRAFH